MSIDDDIKAAWAKSLQTRYEWTASPVVPTMYQRGYRDGYEAAHAPAVIDAMKAQITLLRIELRDALMMAYGTRMNWPESAKALL